MKDKNQECSCETCGCKDEDCSVDFLKEDEVIDEDGFVSINFDISPETMLFICEAVMKKHCIDPASISVFTSGVKKLDKKLKESLPDTNDNDDELLSDIKIDEYTFLLGKAFFNQFTLDALKDTIARGGFEENKLPEEPNIPLNAYENESLIAMSPVSLEELEAAQGRDDDDI